MAYNPNSFVDMAPEGKRGGWRYFGGALLTLLLWLVGVIILIVAAMVAGGAELMQMMDGKTNWVDLTPDQDRLALIACVILLGSLVLLLFATMIVAKLLHGQPMRTLFTARPKFDFRRFFVSGAIYLIINVGLVTVGYYTDPESYQVIFDAARFWPFLIVVLLITPFQAMAEEVFFRGYLTQGMFAVTGSLVLRLLVPSLLFTAMHSANGDWSAGGIWAVLTYMTLAIYLSLLTIKSNGLELAGGLHTFHNIFAFTVITSTGAGMPFATILLSEGQSEDYMMGFVFLLPVLAVHYFICDRLGLMKGADEGA